MLCIVDLAITKKPIWPIVPWSSQISRSLYPYRLRTYESLSMAESCKGPWYCVQNWRGSCVFVYFRFNVACSVVCFDFFSLACFCCVFNELKNVARPTKGVLLFFVVFNNFRYFLGVMAVYIYFFLIKMLNLKNFNGYSRERKKY